MKDNTNLLEPKTLTRCGLWRMHKDNLRAWARGRCLLEYLTIGEVDELTKDQLVDECLGAVLRLEVAEEYQAAAHDTTARPIKELVG